MERAVARLDAGGVAPGLTKKGKIPAWGFLFSYVENLFQFMQDGEGKTVNFNYFLFDWANPMMIKFPC